MSTSFLILPGGPVRSCVQLDFLRRPSVLRYMAMAFWHPPRRSHELPEVVARWKQHTLHPVHLAEFQRLTGLECRDHVPVIYPHTLSFPLVMAVVTHPIFPVPIWSNLQVRNHVVQHLPISVHATVDMEVRLTAQRVLEKGLETDLHTTVRTEGQLVWESITTFYARGRHGAPGEAAPLARAPEVQGEVRMQWKAATDGRRQFGALTGDYNGIHMWRWYASMFGFRAAFLHPHRALGQCLARLPEVASSHPQRLDIWLKGPVYYGSELGLRVQGSGNDVTMALMVNGDDRPAMVMRRMVCAPGQRWVLEEAPPAVLAQAS